MFIANNSIFESIMQYFLARSIALKECYLMTNFENNSLYRFSGGKQTIHKVSAAFIVKNCHPQKSLILFHTGLLETFSPERHPP